MVALLVIVAVLLAAIHVSSALHRRRVARRFAAMSRRPEQSPAADAVRRERLLETAFLAGEVPPVWYRHQKAALAADLAEHDRSL